MLLVGLTGGIASGKSTVAAMLEDRGAVVIDADALAREAVDPGTAGSVKVLDDFGPGVFTPDGRVDRARLAEIVFADPEARRRLEAIVHPEVARLLQGRLAEHRDTDRVVVYVVPLLVEAGLADAFDLNVAVSASEDVRVARARVHRGMSEEDARDRVRAQASERERLAVADMVVRNDGSLEDLSREVEALWEQLRDRAAGRVLGS